MVRPVDRNAHITKAAQTKAEVSKSLEAMKKKTSQFALNAKEKGVFSAGKPASVSDKPPHKADSTRVDKTASSTLTKTARRK